MNFEFEEIFNTLVREIYVRRNAVVLLFVIMSLSILAVGAVWPKKYTASVLIEIDASNILQPLMAGRAETTKPVDHIANAREIIFGESIMNVILDQKSWKEDIESDIEKEKVREKIKKKTTIKSVGEDLIKIEFEDSDPVKAYDTVATMANLFIEKGEKIQMEESQAAFDFINQQVEEYLHKLVAVENGIKEFRSKNPDVRPGLITEVSNRISKLKSKIENTELDIREAKIKLDSIANQLSGEAAITISQSREGQYRSKIAELQTKLENLRLDYKDTYPDILRLKSQIKDLKEGLSTEILRRKAVIKSSKEKGEFYIDEAIILSPLYQELRSNLANTKTHIATLQERKNELEKMLANEYERAAEIHKAEATLSDLTRNYQVNQDIYQDLLKRRENAQNKKNLDQEHHGLTFKIQEAAKIPVLPSGLRFLHFFIIGPIVGLLVPFGLIYIMIQVDPRVRFSNIISKELNLPVLVEIEEIKSSDEIAKEKLNLLMLGAVLVSIAAVYFYIGYQKYSGGI